MSLGSTVEQRLLVGRIKQALPVGINTRLVADTLLVDIHGHIYQVERWATHHGQHRTGGRIKNHRRTHIITHDAGNRLLQ